ncbi:MAG: dihydroxy-acid dehydratase [Starkeya sp.]|nr:dihydroxy-acid dehydratase [Starkeya sp.]
MSDDGSTNDNKKTLRSQAWFGRQDKMGFYYRSFLKNSGQPQDRFDGRPVIGICNTWSELTPCNIHFRDLAEHVRRGVLDAGGYPLEFPVSSLGEVTMRPTAMLFRNLASMDVEEAIRAHPLDGVVLLMGCDKTTPALLMGAASADLPAIGLSGGPQLRGNYRGQIIGSGTNIISMSEQLRAGEITMAEFHEAEAGMNRSSGSCMTMGTASTMASMVEALGIGLPENAAIPAVDARRNLLARMAGRRIVDMVHEDLKPSDILTREAFENAIRALAAIGGSTNAPIHLNALARHVGVELSIDDWQTYGEEVPLLVNLQPAGEYLGEDYYHAGGVPAVVNQLMGQGLIAEDALTVNGRTLGANCASARIEDEAVIRPYDQPLKEKAGFRVLRGNLFSSAIMKTSVISAEFRVRYLSNPDDPDAFEGRAIVFDGPEDYHARIDDPALAIDDGCILFMRGAGPIGYPGAAEVVNMRAPDYLIKAGVHALPCIGDGRQSGTSGSPSILNASPEAAVGGGLALLRTGDRVRIDLKRNSANMLVPEEELARRRAELEAAGGYAYPASQTPWQEIQRGLVGQLETGAVLENAVRYQRIAQTKGMPRDNH